MGFDIDCECYLCNGNEFGLFSAFVCYQCIQRVRKSEKHPIYRDAYSRVCVYGCTFCGEMAGCINASFCRDHIEKLLHLPPQKPWKYSYKDFIRAQMCDSADGSDDKGRETSYHEYLTNLFAGDFDAEEIIDPVERDYLVPLKEALEKYLKSLEDDQDGGPDDETRRPICPIMKKYGIGVGGSWTPL
jgi:hypothetical protein